MGTALATAVKIGFGGTLVLYTTSDAATPVNTGPLAVGAIQSADLTHEDDLIEVKDKDGKFLSSVAFENERLVLNVTALLSGSTAANAALSASLPSANGRAILTGCPVIKMGAWSDAFNVTGSTAPVSYMWIYQGGGKVSMNNDGTASFTATFKRYQNINSASGTAVVAT
jgi:hypothetical protein